MTYGFGQGRREHLNIQRKGSDCGGVHGAVVMCEPEHSDMRKCSWGVGMGWSGFTNLVIQYLGFCSPVCGV